MNIQDLEQALINADRAGDKESARILAAEISKIQSAVPQDTGSIASGVMKRGRQVVEGVKGVGLRAGEAIGLVSPQTLTDYEQRIGMERSVMSPTYQSMTPTGTKEIIGSTGLDVLSSFLGGTALKAAKDVPIVGGVAGATGGALLPSTVPQAAAGGALYSMTTPSETTAEALTKPVVGAVTGGATQFGLRQIGLAPQVPSPLTDQQKEVARRALQQGFVLDPTQITGYGQEIKEGIKRNLPLARRAFTRLEDANQDQTNLIAKTLINIPTTAPLTNETLQSAYNSALNKYKSLENLNSIQGNQKFVDTVNAQIAKLQKIKPEQRSADDKRALRVLASYRTFGSKPMDGEEAFIGVKAIGDNLFQAQKNGSRTAADTFKALRDSFEESIEAYLSSPANLMRQGGDKVLKDFREGRKTLSDWYLIKDAFSEETGNVSASRLARQLSKKPSYGTTGKPIETAAMLSGAFPKAFPSSGTVEGQSFRTIADIAGLVAAPTTYAATSGPVRNILAQRAFGAKPEGLIGNVYGGITGVGRYLPEEARNAFGRALLSAEQQNINQMLAPINFGLLGQ